MKLAEQNKKNEFGIDAETLRRLSEILLSDQKVSKALIFGSRSKGDFQKGSDIDIALSGSKISIEDILSMKIRLEQLMLPYTVDLIRFENISNQELKEHIKRVGKEI